MPSHVPDLSEIEAQASPRVTHAMTVVCATATGWVSPGEMNDAPGTMPIMDATAAWTAVVAIATFAAAAVAAVAARQSRNAAKEANAAADTLAKIERDRRHDELAPVFDLEFTNTGGDEAVLELTLSGGRLESLDAVMLTILNDQDHSAGELPDGVTQGAAEGVVWGPYEFNIGNTYAPFVSSRQTQPRPYSRLSGKTGDPFPLRRTRPPDGADVGRWRKDYAGKPIRLLITCRREGYEPWMLPRDVYPKQAGPEQRKQAGEIRIERRTYDGAQARVLPEDATAPVYMLVVTNDSNRPIRNVAAAIQDAEVFSGNMAVWIGTLTSEHTASGTTNDLFAPVTTGGELELLPARVSAAFVWSVKATTYPKAKFTVRFTDDAEIAWEVGPDLRVTELDDRNDW